MKGFGMKQFSLEPDMLTIGGMFYPTGHLVVMVPQRGDAQKIEHDLRLGDNGVDDVMLLEPQAIIEQLGQTMQAADSPLPSIGTEGATVRRYVELARQGHHGLLIYAPSQEETGRVMDVVRTVPFSYAQKYHSLVIEDLS
jgi:hypothetical protein